MTEFRICGEYGRRIPDDILDTLRLFQRVFADLMKTYGFEDVGWTFNTDYVPESSKDIQSASPLLKCKDCRHWESYNNADHPFGECHNRLLLQEGRPVLNGLAESDTMGYDPCIYTGPEFGCIHAETPPATPTTPA